MYRAGTPSALNDLDDAVGVGDTDHTDHLSEVWDTPRVCLLIVPYTAVYITPLPGLIFRAQYLHSWSSIGAQKVRPGKHVAESFRKTYRSVLAPSWLSSSRAGKTAPGGCDAHHRVPLGYYTLGIPGYLPEYGQNSQALYPGVPEYVRTLPNTPL